MGDEHDGEAHELARQVGRAPCGPADESGEWNMERRDVVTSRDLPELGATLTVTLVR